ncbi:bifunctional P-loop containing nucleoside triphosphate hydrolase/DEAD2/Helicase-like [Babesia duncani]|uniref:Bifunctional P-loop containing nucleoside triphosphate hydrolase/DEAD2/Helicase-like n=1 Tax=Babesia duncani TaxID=323732 RepID=A0AAD9PK78_9APIC|nr:bifunctional P-loop containing nucleoside triphosphate hydrolase/DEAD2/Helicase-like [Babesia duncani]
MGSVIKAIKDKENALLESPTGTGKTLSLLCASFGCLWNDKLRNAHADGIQQKRKNDNRHETTIRDLLSGIPTSYRHTSEFDKAKLRGAMRIIYSSRTHAQLKQVIQEVKKTSYSKEFLKRGITAVSLGSRDQMCIHPGRKNLVGEALNTFCRNQCQKNQCIYYNGIRGPQGAEEIHFYEVMDIEDLVSLARSKRCCPYYAAKAAQENAAVTFLPYNYLLSPQTRASMDIRLHNAVVLIDEAHNIEKVAEESATFKLRQVDVAKYLGALRRFAAFYKVLLNSGNALIEEKDPVNIDALSKLSKALGNLDQFLSQVKLTSFGSNTAATDFESWQIQSLKAQHAVFKANKLIQHMKNNLGFDQIQGKAVATALSGAKSILSTEGVNIGSSFEDIYKDHKSSQEDCNLLDSLRDTLQQFYSTEVQSCPEYFHVYIAEEGVVKEPTTIASGWNAKKKSSQDILPKTMTFACLQATPSFLRLRAEGVQSIILTSGTLTPMEQMEEQIGGGHIKFNIKLSNNHIIDPSRVWASVVTGTKSDPHCLVSDYNTRAKIDYVLGLGNALISFLQHVPLGVLVFFGSYPFMESTIKLWKHNHLFSVMERAKTIFVEERGDGKSDLVQSQLIDYKNQVDLKRGCAFFGVCRGKIAEGIDFPNDYCRGVFMCGIPYPNTYDTSTALKMDYLNRMASKNRNLASEWYTGQAIRAINQAVGRCIRHANDYGCILLADNRYSVGTFKSRISSWVLKKLQVRSNMDSCLDSLSAFFQPFSATEKSTKATHVKRSPLDENCKITKLEPNSQFEFKMRKVHPSGNMSLVTSSNCSKGTGLVQTKIEFIKKEKIGLDALDDF